MGKATEGWCILRCAGSQTLQLASSLRDAGFEAWSPVEVREVTKPDRSKPGGVRKETITKAAMPDWVFAKADLIDLINLATTSGMKYQTWDSAVRRMIYRGHPKFSVFFAMGRHHYVTDRFIEIMQKMESKRKPRGLVKVFAVGAKVRLSEGGFEGLHGTIESVQGKQAKVVFDGSVQAFAFPMWILLDDEVVINVGSRLAEPGDQFRDAA